MTLTPEERKRRHCEAQRRYREKRKDYYHEHSKRFWEEKIKANPVRHEIAKQKSREWIKKNRQRHTQNAMNWRQKNRQEYLRIRRTHRMRKYGMTIEDFERMVQDQSGCCALCQRPFGDKPICVDHDHDTGAVRGLLHINCNVLIGMAHEDTDVLRRAIVYLDEGIGRE